MFPSSWFISHHITGICKVRTLGLHKVILTLQQATRFQPCQSLHNCARLCRSRRVAVAIALSKSRTPVDHFRCSRALFGLRKGSHENYTLHIKYFSSILTNMGNCLYRPPTATVMQQHNIPIIWRKWLMSCASCDSY